MAQRILVDNLVSDTRRQLDEANRESVRDDEDILPALNRAQNYALDILARKYKEPILTHRMITLLPGESEYDIPEDAFEQRLLLVESFNNNTFSELELVDFKDIGRYEVVSQNSSLPYYYCVIGDKFKIIPSSVGQGRQLRLWYLLDPMPLVLSQGRVNLVNAASNYIILDAIGTDLTTESDNLDSFVNLIDGASGRVKGTLQIQSIINTKVQFKSVPTRTTVLDIVVDTDLAALTSGLTLEQDDYVCLSSGTCVPFLKKPLSNFLTQYAVAELTRKLGGVEGLEEGVLKRFEEQIDKAWVMRPNGLRVRKRNSRWTTLLSKRGN